MRNKLKNIIKKLLKEAVKKTYPDQDFSSLLEIQNVTAKNIQADYFTNISMKLAKILKTNPIEIADKNNNENPITSLPVFEAINNE